MQILLETALKNQDNVAIIDQNGERQTTYGELVALARKVAAYLQQKQIPDQSYVCILLPSSMEYMAAEIGIWLSRCVVVPLGQAFPQARIDYIVNHCESSLVIREQTLDEIRELEPIQGRLPQGTDNSLLMYTSGSTGNPKGVLHTAAAMTYYTLHFLSGLIDSGDVLAYTSPFYFNTLHILHGVLLVGGIVHLCSREICLDIRKMESYISENGINFVIMTPSMLSAFNNRSALLKKVFALGEKQVGQCSKDGYILYNVYGMTELGGSYISMVMPEKPMEGSPIGYPQKGMEFKIIDDDGKDVKSGCTGELCLKGVFCKEYFKNPEETAKLYVDGWLHTGDLVRQGEDGLLYYIERKDWMVKINGQRVEPGEIENAIRTVAGVRYVVVKNVKNPAGNECLCAYYSVCDGASVTEEMLRAAISEKLPAYMVPQCFVRLEKFTLNANGKVDRQALPDPFAMIHREMIPPATIREKIVYDMAKKILVGEEFGVTDDLFHLGLTSLEAMQLVCGLPKEWGIRVSDVMSVRTIRRLLLEKNDVAYYYDGYNGDRKTVALVCGLVGFSNLASFIEMLSSRYNVLVFEHMYFTVMHSDDVSVLLSSDGYYEFIRLYSEKLHLLISEDQTLSMVIGFSFAGTMAYSLAAQWHEETGQTPIVMAGDSIYYNIVGESPLHEFDNTKPEQLREVVRQICNDEYVGDSEAFYKAFLVKICHHCNALPEYSGHVIMLQALQGTSEMIIPIRNGLNKIIESDNKIISKFGSGVFAAVRYLYRKTHLKELIKNRSKKNKNLFVRDYKTEFELKLKELRKYAADIEVVEIDDTHNGLLDKVHYPSYLKLIADAINVK